MGKRKNASYYKHGGKKGRYSAKLEGGMRGVLITCNKRERESVREAFNLFNEYADRLYGPEEMTKPDDAEASADDGSDEEDIEAALKKEVDILKKTKPTQRRFMQVDTGTNNVVFIRTTLENPIELVNTIFNETLSTQKSKCRFILKMVPVIGTSSAHEDNMAKAVRKLLEPHIGHGRPITYSIHIKVRNNNSLSRMSLLPVLGRVITDLNPSARVDFTNPDCIIQVDVLKTVACFGYLTEFTQFRKYNLQEVVEANRTINKPPKAKGKEPQQGAKPEEEGDIMGNDGKDIEVIEEKDIKGNEDQDINTIEEDNTKGNEDKNIDAIEEKEKEIDQPKEGKWKDKVETYNKEIEGSDKTDKCDANTAEHLIAQTVDGNFTQEGHSSADQQKCPADNTKNNPGTDLSICGSTELIKSEKSMLQSDNTESMTGD